MSAGAGKQFSPGTFGLTSLRGPSATYYDPLSRRTPGPIGHDRPAGPYHPCIRRRRALLLAEVLVAEEAVIGDAEAVGFVAQLLEKTESGVIQP